MKNLKIKKAELFRLAIIITCLVLPMISFAQLPDPCDQGCPIDGGLSLLIGAGVGYGVKKYREVKKAGREEGMSVGS